MLAFKRVSRPKENRTIMAVFAHPDDEAFLVGGTLAHYARQGINIDLVCLTRGEKGSTEKLPGAEKNLARLRQSELEKCCKVLGARLLPTQIFPDGKLAEIGSERLVRPIEKLIKTRQPDIVLTFGPDGLTGHPDHIAIHQATTRAFQKAAQPGKALFYASLAAYHVDRLSNRLDGSLGDLPLRLTGIETSQISAAIDIRHTSHLKWAALNCHRTQSSNFAGLNQADVLLLSHLEHFRLARIAGLHPGLTFAPRQVQAGLFEVLDLAKKVYLEIAS
jgi:LmbE family N-acetylglucosaminyl deacetylase